jgi:hypothetical protein
MTTKPMHPHLLTKEDLPTSNNNLVETTMAIMTTKTTATPTIWMPGMAETTPGTMKTTPATTDTTDKPPPWETAHGVEVRSNNEGRGWPPRHHHELALTTTAASNCLWGGWWVLTNGDRGQEAGLMMGTMTRTQVDDRKWEQRGEQMNSRNEGHGKQEGPAASLTKWAQMTCVIVWAPGKFFIFVSSFSFG